MYFIFVDESGYHPNWDDENAIKEQPVYVLAAVAVPSGKLAQLYEAIRNGVDQLGLPEINGQALGRGEEIKAKDVDDGKGFWREKSYERERVRQIYLDQQATTYFVVCVDKARHRDRYPSPRDPAHLALQFLLERLQGFLNENNEAGFVLIDANKRLEPELRERSSQLLLEGSWGIAVSRFYEELTYEWHLKMSKILEIHFGDSRYSLGLQIADFVARHTYSWWKSNKDPGYPGWNYIEPRLYRYRKNYHGWGYKEFP